MGWKPAPLVRPRSSSLLPLAAVDDATKNLLAALFVPAECSEAYLWLLAMILKRHGIPMAIYHDRHICLVCSDERWSQEEQLKGYQFPTHVGRVLAELGIEPISATSPQAKGRIERSFGTLQDRLLAELHLNGITDIDTANAWLETTYIDRYNIRFADTAQIEGTAFVPISPADIHHHVAFAYETTVGDDNAVRLGGLIIDIPRDPIAGATPRPRSRPPAPRRLMDRFARKEHHRNSPANCSAGTRQNLESKT
jgi:hypothetical protein